jgi:hypothetical protein
MTSDDPFEGTPFEGLPRLSPDEIRHGDDEHALATAMILANVPDTYDTDHAVGGLATKVVGILDSLGWQLVRRDSITELIERRDKKGIEQ